MSIYSDTLRKMGEVQYLIRKDSSTNGKAIKIVKEAKKPIGDSPETWNLATETLKSGNSYEPTRAEIAVGVALRLGLSHLRKARREVQGDVRLGEAIGKLKNLSETTLSSRLSAISKTSDIVALEHHLGTLISMLSGGGSQAFSQINYAALAQDLYMWQDPSQRDKITSRWIRDAYTSLRKDS